MKHLFFAFIVFLSVNPSRGSSLDSERFPDGSEISLSSPIEILPSGGFFPVRVEVINKGRDSMVFKLEAEASLQPGSYYGFRNSYDSRGTLRSNFGLSCPAGESRLIDLLIPMNERVGNDEQNLSLNVFNSQGAQVLSNYLNNDSSNEYHIGVSSEFLMLYRNELESNWSSSSTYSSSSNDSIGAVEVTSLPEDWRAYAGYDALALMRRDFLAMTPGVKLALDQWVRSGGHLILLNDDQELLPGFEGGSVVDGFGQRSVVRCGEQYRAFQVASLASLIRGEESLAVIHGTQYNDGLWPVGRALGSRSLQTGLLLFILIIFAVVVGPVNLFVWANKHRRHRLFITTPIISIVTSLLLVAYIMFRDGFGGDGARAIAIEVGGPDDKTAVVVQEQFSRSGILFSSGFTMDDDSVLNPVSPPESDLNREDSSSAIGTFTLEMARSDEGWEVSGDLFESRSEQAQLVRSVIPSREGLELISGAGEAPRLASSFSYALGPVYYTDREGEVWKAEEIDPGGTVVMSPSSVRDQWPDLMDAISRFGKSYQGTLKSMVARKGSFAALADEAPSIVTHTSIDWMKSPVLVTGLTNR